MVALASRHREHIRKTFVRHGLKACRFARRTRLFFCQSEHSDTFNGKISDGSA